MGEWSGQIVLVVSGLLFFWLGVMFLRRARQRRRELYADEPVRIIRESAEEPARETPEPFPRDETPEPEPEPEPEPVVDEALRRGLQKTSDGLFGRIGKLFGSGDAVDPKVLDELEEVLLVADVGVKLATSFVADLRGEIRAGRMQDGNAVRAALRQRLLTAITTSDLLPSSSASDPLHLAERSAGDNRPRVILFVGVNGVGKTTTIGKVASKLKAAGKEVLLAAGDTFRAGAVEQLAVWGERTGCELVRGEPGHDPASVIFRAVERGSRDGVDVVLADTAGRLHTNTDLMDEIRKVKKAAGKARDGAPDEVWLIVDATTGQNAVRQADEFNRALGITGVILTKLDGTAKGGVVIAIADALKLPVIFVGVGEKADDLLPFDPKGFIDAIFTA